jgi:ubiquinone/menaquinone biosynthesis C-methylase UbiE
MTVSKQVEYWNKTAATLEDGEDRVTGKGFRQTVCNKLVQEHDLGEVVEFGCGTGAFTKSLAHNAKHIVATDLSDEMIKVAKKRLEGVRIITVEKADCENTSFISGRFDTVFMGNLIHVVENPRRALQESWRILRNDGTLLITSQTIYGMKPFEKIKMYLRAIKVFTMWGKPPGNFRTNYSPDELSSLAESAGFKVEKVELIGDRMKALYLKARKNQQS